MNRSSGTSACLSPSAPKAVAISQRNFRSLVVFSEVMSTMQAAPFSDDDVWRAAETAWVFAASTDTVVSSYGMDLTDPADAAFQPLSVAGAGLEPASGEGLSIAVANGPAAAI